MGSQPRKPKGEGGGQFAHKQPPDMVGPPAGLSLADENPGVEVSWIRRSSRGQAHVINVRPAAGPFAGHNVSLTVKSTKRRQVGADWRGVAEIYDRGWISVRIARIGPSGDPPAGQPPRWESQGEVIHALTRLMGGDASGLCWRPVLDGPAISEDRDGGWRPMSELGAWLPDKAAS